MSDEISVEGIRRIAEADDWKNFPGWKGTRALARLALRLRAEVERLKKALTEADKNDEEMRLLVARTSKRAESAEARAAELERALRPFASLGRYLRDNPHPTSSPTWQIIERQALDAERILAPAKEPASEEDR